MSFKIPIQEIGEDELTPEEREAFLEGKDILSCTVIPISELPDDMLEVIFKQSPNWVAEKRPDWVRNKYPRFFN